MDSTQIEQPLLAALLLVIAVAFIVATVSMLLMVRHAKPEADITKWWNPADVMFTPGLLTDVGLRHRRRMFRAFAVSLTCFALSFGVQRWAAT